MRTAKVCLVGDFGVGKTSLVQRFVHQAFSRDYQTTLGVTIETLTLTLPGDTVLKLIIWDIAGSDEMDSVRRTYLQGAEGLVLVADGTRSATLDTALSLGSSAGALLGAPPAVLLLNKHDRTDDWAVDEQAVAAGTRAPVFCTSALSGAGVSTAFEALAGMIVA